MRSSRGHIRLIVIACTAVAGCAGDAHRSRGDAQPNASDVTLDGGVPDAPLTRDVGHHYDGAILAFVATRIYNDLPSLDTKDATKFEMFLLQSIRPPEVAGIRVFGPDGFTFDFMNVPYDVAGNGYMQNEREPSLWYQAFRFSTLADGRYTARVTFTDGERQEDSRVLASGGSILDFYLAHRDEMQFAPDGGVSSATSTELTWSTFHDLGGPDAYYNAWISSGTGESISATNLRGGTALIDGFIDPTAGLNTKSFRPGSESDPLPLGPLTWQVEILDSNKLDEINQIIFPLGRHFVAQ